MNENIKQILSAGAEVKYLKNKYKAISHLTSLLVVTVMIFVVFTLSYLSSWALGINIDSPLRHQNYYEIWLLILFISIPIGAVFGWLCILPVIANAMIKLNWLTIFEAESFKKYGRFPPWCQKNS